LVAVSRLAPAQPPPARFVLPDVLERAGAYVRDFQRQLSGIVVEERYVQEVKCIRDLPSRGRFWIEPGTGRVLASELVADDPFVRGTIDVKYQPEAAVNLFVPIEMRERYEPRKDSSKVEGTATYGRFRQFQVKVDEKIAPIK
jgi:hypothetical protein